MSMSAEQILEKTVVMLAETTAMLTLLSDTRTHAARTPIRKMTPGIRAALLARHRMV